MSKQQLREQELQRALATAAAELRDLALLTPRVRELKHDCEELLEQLAHTSDAEQLLEATRSALQELLFQRK